MQSERENTFLKAYSEAVRTLRIVERLALSESCADAIIDMQKIVDLCGFGAFMILRSVVRQDGAFWRVIGCSIDLQPIFEGVIVRDGCEGKQRISSETAGPDENLAMTIRQFRQRMDDAGLRSISMISFRNAGIGARHILLVANGPAKSQAGPERPPFLLRVALATFLETTCGEASTAGSGLSAAEVAVLELVAVGLRPSEIARQRRTSVRTIRNQLESARIRLCARTTAHALAVALEEGELFKRSTKLFDVSTSGGSEASARSIS